MRKNRRVQILHVLSDRNMAIKLKRIRYFKTAQAVAGTFSLACIALAAFGWHWFPSLLGFGSMLILVAFAFLALVASALFYDYRIQTEAILSDYDVQVSGGMWI